jgi:hypothetical protein
VSISEQVSSGGDMTHAYPRPSAGEDVCKRRRAAQEDGNGYQNADSDTQRSR